jgi:glycosyltransferase involved in cell wall biosynthesis
MISIAMCTYNGENYIGEQLDCIIKQSLQVNEIVVVDDCSDDDTVNIVRTKLKNWNGKKVIIKNATNIGYKKNFQKAISLCSGDIVFLSDQDDVWDLNKVEILSNILAGDSNIVLTFHDSIITDDKLEILHKSFWQILDFNQEDFYKGNYSAFLERNVVQGSACAFRRYLFKAALPFPPEVEHDEWLALVALTKGRIVPVPRPLMKYRQGRQNAIGVKTTSRINSACKWILRIRDTARIHFLGMQRIAIIFKNFEERFSSINKLENKIDYRNYNSLMKRRISCINNGDFFIVSLLPSYFRVYSFNRAVKAFIEDLFVLAFKED